MRISLRKKDRSPRPRRHRLHLEVLEDRSLLSTFTVLNTNDSGQGSLRQAILDANAAGGANSIAFNIGSGGAQTITPLSELPSLQNSIFLDGTTQPGFSGVPLIHVIFTGNSDFSVAGNNNTVRGLELTGSVLSVSGGSNVIEGDYIGTDGSVALINGGLAITGPNNVIGGTVPAARNIIAGITSGATAGILIDGEGSATATATGNVIEGNYIGTDVTGTKAVGNGTGIEVLPGCQGTVIGGTAPGAGNVISGNADGIVINGDSLIGLDMAVTIEGNYIGTDFSGTKPLGNSGYGVLLIDADNCVIGGPTPAARNVISANGSNIEMDAGEPSILGSQMPVATDNVVENNYIGTQVDGQSPILPQSSSNPQVGTGITINCDQNTITNNTIAFTGRGIYLDSGTSFTDIEGILVNTTPAIDNRISQNSLFDNNFGGIIFGIPTGGAGLANDGQSAPVLTSEAASGNQTVITGTLSSIPSTTFTIEFFSASGRDLAGSMEGRTFLGSSSVTTNVSGNADFTFTGPASTASFFTATATDPSGNTSQFWQPNQPTPVISNITINSVGGEPERTTVTLTINGTNLYTTSSVEINGVGLSAIETQSFVSPNELQAAIVLPRNQTAGITVVNAGSGNETSNSVTVTITPSQFFVAELYKALLNRAAEPAGLSSWVNDLASGATPEQVAAAIETSGEYRTDEVQKIYNQYLKRNADPAGLNVFVSLLEQGRTLEQVIASVVGSAEFYQIQGGGTNNGFLSALYNDALNRSIDSGGQAAWDQAFANGATTYEIAGAILTSQEYRQNLITSWYLAYLGRQPDSAGLNAWLMQVAQGVRDETIVADILGSPEYFNNPQP